MPSGVLMSPTYDSMKNDIERLVSMKARKYNIPSYEFEDIAQEIRLVAIRALEKYDALKNHSTPFHFIARCVDNYLINLRRDNDAFISKKKLEVADVGTLGRLDAKRKLYYPVPLSDDEYSDTYNAEKSHSYEVHESILVVLPSGLHASYWMLVNNGSHAIPKKDFTQIKKIVLELYG